MKCTKYLLLLTSIFLINSCYNAKIVTDKNPSSQIIEKPWASSFIYGLVPPKIVKTASECPNGLAKVDTKISFLNGLASSITFGIYTPMHITVTCAAGSGTAMNKDKEDPIRISKTGSEKEQAKALQDAAQKSIDTGNTVYVDFN